MVDAATNGAGSMPDSNSDQPAMATEEEASQEDPQAEAAKRGSKPHGRYIVAPDSAPAVPTAMLNNVIEDEVVKTANEVLAWDAKLTEPGTGPSFFHVPDDRRALISSLGGESALRVLDQAGSNSGFAQTEGMRHSPKS